MLATSRYNRPISFLQSRHYFPDGFYGRGFFYSWPSLTANGDIGRFITGVTVSRVTKAVSSGITVLPHAPPVTVKTLFGYQATCTCLAVQE
jgi:hypothetical protein